MRQVIHAQRHGLIFTAYRALQPGRGFVLVSDHDPLPLRYQFEAQYPGEFTGKMLNSKLGKAQFWLLFLGFHMTFLVQQAARLRST